MGLPEAAAIAAAPGNRRGDQEEVNMKITVDADRMHSMAAEIRTTVDALRYNMELYF